LHPPDHPTHLPIVNEAGIDDRVRKGRLSAGTSDRAETPDHVVRLLRYCVHALDRSEGVPDPLIFTAVGEFGPPQDVDIGDEAGLKRLGIVPSLGHVIHAGSLPEEPRHVLHMPDLDRRVLPTTVRSLGQARVGLSSEPDAPVVVTFLARVPWRARVEHRPNLFQRNGAV
jgi:hypothetical protein